jgi:predicted transcriptional regulator
MGGLANRMSVFDSLQPEQSRRDTLPERTMADVLVLPENLRTMMDYLIKQGESELAEVAAHMGQDETSTRALLTDLIEKGFVQELVAGRKHCYRVRLVSRRRSHLPLDL